jgi:DNA invertase Pin-like site-specific DNA recombinase
MANGRPWWKDDPELIALRERALAGIEGAPELVGVDELEAVRARYRNAVAAARTAGLSWTEIGRLLGVSRQQVYRRFRRRVAD